MMQISLSAARENAELKQYEAAKLLGITPKTLRGYERGKTVIPSNTLRKAANLYNIPSDNIRLHTLDDGEYDEKILNDTTV